MEEEKQSYDIDTVARMLAVKPDTICQLVEQGSLPARKIGGHLSFRPEDIETYLDTVRIEPEGSNE